MNNRVWSMELIGGILHDENTITGLPLLSSPAKKIYYSQWLRTCFLVGVSKIYDTTTDNHEILPLKTCPQVTGKNTIQ